MASPPYSSAASPPAASPLALPRQRPTLALPVPSSSALDASRRKGSISSAVSMTSSLRHASFPPALSLEAQHQQAEDDALAQYSPGADDTGSLDEFSDAEIMSAISGPAGGGDDPGGLFSRKRKRTGNTSRTGLPGGGGGEKRARGRPPKNPSLRRGSVSIANGTDDGRGGSATPVTARRGGTAGARSVLTGDADADAEDDEDEDDDDDAGGRGGAATGGGGAAATAEGEGFWDAAELERENQRRYLFREAVHPAHQGRYDAFNKVKLRTADVRRLINATLSQSVPQNVVTVAGAYTKMFAGLMVEAAREVQAEWMVAEPKRSDNVENPAWRKLREMHAVHQEDEIEDGEATGRRQIPDAMETDGTDPAHKQNPNEPALQNGESGQVHPHPSDVVKGAQPGAWGLSKHIEDCDRGPLLPDHLREALRRYKQSRSGGSVGFTGLSLEGREVAAPRMGGRRLFR